jgi:uncharacterized metal-binding protein YceD (DUF177 family)
VKIPLIQLRSPLTINISGTEAWLAEIYAAFPTPKGVQKPLITGEIKLALNQMNPSTVDVTGEIRYAPYVDCSRCADAIVWPIRTQIKVQFNLGKDPSALLEGGVGDDIEDYYYIGEELDIEPMINDRIHTAIPLQTVKKTEDLSSCLECGLSLAAEKVYGDAEPAKEKSPFEILAELKLKQ